jgi:hypothetical protein
MLDGQGLEIATDDPRVIDGLDRMTAALLAYTNDAGAVLDAARADPGCVAAQAWSAALMMFMEDATAAARARPHLAAARAALGRASPREVMLTEAIGAWVEGDLDRALQLHEAIAQRWPRDVAAAKLGQYHAFNRGDARRLRDLAQTILPANAENGFVYGMLAFGHEQCRELDAAERLGRRAVELNRQDPWAHHAVAHVLDSQGRIDEGIAWMEDLAATWERCNSFMYTHNWWHTALFMIDRDDHAGALRLYDTRVWGRWKEYSQDQIGAVALLARLELRGVDVGERWADVADHLEARTGDTVNGFLCWHYVYGLARAGRDAATAELRRSIATVAEVQGGVWAEVVLPVADGLVAHARGRWAETVAALGPRLGRLHEAGGSHAQRDLLTQIHLDALVRAELWDEARARWGRRLARRPTIPFVQRQVAALAARERG